MSKIDLKIVYTLWMTPYIGIQLGATKMAEKPIYEAK